MNPDEPLSGLGLATFSQLTWWPVSAVSVSFHLAFGQVWGCAPSLVELALESKEGPCCGPWAEWVAVRGGGGAHPVLFVGSPVCCRPSKHIERALSSLLGSSRVFGCLFVGWL